MNSKQFRKELIKVMPGYKWTVHRSTNPEEYISATGIQTSGYNRMSTLFVERVEFNKMEYTVASSGFGKNVPWLSAYKDKTLARALRGLQKHYEIMASNYRKHANDLQVGRAEKI